jgi:hypothetical protein
MSALAATMSHRRQLFCSLSELTKSAYSILLHEPLPAAIVLDP